MEKTAVLGELLYVGFVFEKGRCASSGIWGLGKRKSMSRHLSVLDLLVRSISSGEVTREDHEAVRLFLRLVREDRAIGKHYPIREELLHPAENDVSGLIDSVDLEKLDPEINSRMQSLITEVLTLLEKPIFVPHKRICVLIKALHNLPRVYLVSAGPTLCNLNQTAIGREEALRYSLSYMDDKRRKALGYNPNLGDKFMTELLGNQTDDSRDLKNGEVKGMLIAAFLKEFPEFGFAGYKRGCYFFERVRIYRERPIYEVFHVCHSLKGRCFSCSVSSCFDKTNAYGTSYNIGPINPHRDLITIVKNTGVIKVEDAYYFHNGKVRMTEAVINKILEDHHRHAIKYLNKRFDAIADNRLLNEGLEFISQLETDPEKLLRELEEQLMAAKYLVGMIKQPQFIELKDRLMRIKFGTKEERQYIPNLSYELLKYYCHTRTESLEI